MPFAPLAILDGAEQQATHGGLNLAAWITGAWEVRRVMSMIGAPVCWLDAFVIESLAQPIHAVARVIPGGLGAHAMGRRVALRAGRHGRTRGGHTPWLVKRGRELVFAAVGLVYLALRTRTAQRG